MLFWSCLREIFGPTPKAAMWQVHCLKKSLSEVMSLCLGIFKYCSKKRLMLARLRTLLRVYTGYLGCKLNKRFCSSQATSPTPVSSAHALLFMPMPWGASKYHGPQGRKKNSWMSSAGTEVNTWCKGDQLFFLAGGPWRREGRTGLLWKGLCQCPWLLLRTALSFTLVALADMQFSSQLCDKVYATKGKS